jgi:phospholipase C
MTSQSNNPGKIEHIVVLMMENRSFDNVLGRLYPDDPNFYIHLSRMKGTPLAFLFLGALC